MRRLKLKEIEQRGCKWCKDMQKEKPSERASVVRMCCLHKKCPYRDLDGFECYDDFIRATGGELPE